MTTEAKIIDQLLSIIEAQIDADAERLDSQELDEYVIAAILAHKKYGRVATHVNTVVNIREGISGADLMAAGLTYEDYKAAYNYKESA